MSTTISRDDILTLLVDRLATVLGVSRDELDEDVRFDEDLHADSLDLVEAIEAVERALTDKGIYITMEEETLIALRTVGDAADRLVELVEEEA